MDLGFYRPDPECGCADCMHSPLRGCGNLYLRPFLPLLVFTLSSNALNLTVIRLQSYPNDPFPSSMRAKAMYQRDLVLVPNVILVLVCQGGYVGEDEIEISIQGRTRGSRALWNTLIRWVRLCACLLYPSDRREERKRNPNRGLAIDADRRFKVGRRSPRGGGRLFPNLWYLERNHFRLSQLPPSSSSCTVHTSAWRGLRLSTRTNPLPAHTSSLGAH